MSYCVETAAKELQLELPELEEIVRLMVDEAHRKIAEARQALAENKSDRYYACMHTIKGAAGNLRMKELAMLAAQAEKVRFDTGLEQERDLVLIEQELGVIESIIDSMFEV